MTEVAKVIICAICVLNLPFGMAQKASSFVVQLEKVVTESSNEDLLSFDLSVACVGRNKYALSGTVTVNYAMDEKCFIEAKTYRSMTGNTDYKILPYAIAKKSYVDTANNEYKDYLMPSIKDCSTWPQFKDQFEPPLEQKTYVLNQCTAEPDWLPDNLPEGYYLVEIIGSGEVDWKISLFVRLLRVYEYA